MRALRALLALCVTCAVLLTTMTSASAHPRRPSARVLETGLSSPKGLGITDHGDLVIGQGAFGAPGPVLVHLTHGRDRGDSVPVTEPLNLVDVAVSPHDGTGWGIGGDQVLYHQRPDGTIDPVLDIAAYQATDPDPADQEGNPTESNPYGLAVTRDGDALVADAAGNDLIRVTPAGEARTVARFDVEMVATDHLPPEMGLPPTLPAEAVPTSVTIGRDGTIYVGELKGFPFRPGSSRIWRIDPDADGALCSATAAADDCRTHSRGLTAIQDIAIDRGTGKLYVYELAEDGVLAFEAGFETGEFPPAVLLEISRHHRREIARGSLSQPGGVVARHGKVYVTDGVMGEGTGRLLRVR
jgi:hypothetical protein